MAVNKNALVRYKVLDSCFRNPGRRFFIEDLIGECNAALAEIDPQSNGISRRQILDDIAFMESEEGWAIDLKRTRDRRRVFYHYADLTFSINNMPLNEIEINHLKSAVDILSQFKGMPQFEWMHELVPKLQQGAHKDNTRLIIDFDHNPYLKGIERLGLLHSAILYKKVLKISYKPFESDAASDVTIHPYYLKQYNNRWFLFGYNAERNKRDWNMALDRINDVTEVRAPYDENAEIDWSEYFEDMIGVTKPAGASPENIVLHFKGKTAKYIESKPLHGSQKSKWTGDEILQVNLNVIINYELEHLILSYGESVIVQSPEKLQLRIKERLEGALSNYLE